MTAWEIIAICLNLRFKFRLNPARTFSGSSDSGYRPRQGEAGFGTADYTDSWNFADESLGNHLRNRFNLRESAVRILNRNRQKQSLLHFFLLFCGFLLSQKWQRNKFPIRKTPADFIKFLFNKLFMQKAKHFLQSFWKFRKFFRNLSWLEENPKPETMNNTLKELHIGRTKTAWRRNYELHKDRLKAELRTFRLAAPFPHSREQACGTSGILIVNKIWVKSPDIRKTHFFLDIIHHIF